MERVKFELPEGAESVTVKVEDGCVVATYEPKRWRAERGERYFYVTSRGYSSSTWDDRNYCDDKRYSIGNYYKTEEQANKVSPEIISIFLKHKHD